MRDSTIELRQISKDYEGETVLHHISFQFRSGVHTSIIGPSGCGKSTTLRLIAGLEAPSAGEVWKDGSIASRPGKVCQPPHLRGIGMVFQDLALWPNLSVADNVLLGLSARRLGREDCRWRAHQALLMCGIDSLSSRRPATLSGGQQQRVALARALAVRPGFLLLDEPFSGLDLLTKIELLDQISALATDQNITVILVSHDPMEALFLCRSAVVLAEGRIEEKGDLRELLETPQSETLRVFKEHLRGVRYM